jgi:hypothetical protein
MTTQFPHEFEELLSPAGREVLAGTHPAVGALAREPFLAAPGLLDTSRLDALTALIAETFEPMVIEISRQLPPANGSTLSFEDTLPKVGSMMSVPFEGAEAYIARKLAEQIGLFQMLHSESYHRFVQALAGRPLDTLATAQVLNNRPGDYAGPHTDHHPNEPLVKDGYVDVHLTFCTPGVEQQYIVYQRHGHLSAIAPIAVSGTVTAYRLPLWHYTTPLQTRAPQDRRWLVLSTFAFAETAAALAAAKPSS